MRAGWHGADVNTMREAPRIFTFVLPTVHLRGLEIGGSTASALEIGSDIRAYRGKKVQVDYQSSNLH